ncbi:MAG: type II toxin-antitoxin system RelE/ParE family toxin [Halobacteriota archaeon]|nr:type II toxin-antitoxin system RelE/ParE family toxin [Halobacteriota archaeon]
MAFKVEYKSSVTRDFKKLDKQVALRIIDQQEATLSEDPSSGVPLTGQFEGLFELQIGDYRVIYTKKKDGALVLRIGHRSKVYR